MSGFQQIQHAFVEHLRDPDNNPFPEPVEDRRLKIYRELFFNNVNGFVSAAFPVLKSLYSEEAWQRLVREFFAQHDCTTPIFLEISQEFMAFLQQEHQPTSADPAFLLELAHYEWVELDISTRKHKFSYPQLQLDQLTENTQLVLAETAWPLSYRFPVHRISADYVPEKPPEQPSYLLVYRDADDDVQFMELNAATAKLMQVIVESPGITLGQLVEEMARLMPQLPKEQISQGILATLAGLVERDVVRHFQIRE